MRLHEPPTTLLDAPVTVPVHLEYRIDRRRPPKRLGAALARWKARSAALGLRAGDGAPAGRPSRGVSASGRRTVNSAKPLYAVSVEPDVFKGGVVARRTSAIASSSTPFGRDLP